MDVKTMEPAAWPTNPAKEWCPPGHGDLYAALSGSGKLDEVCTTKRPFSSGTGGGGGVQGIVDGRRGEGGGGDVRGI